MMFQLSIESFRRKLSQQGWEDSDINEVLDILLEGMDVQITDTPIEVKVGEVSISIGRSVCDFSVEGLGPLASNIMSIRVPELDASNSDPMTLDVTIIPFQLTTPNGH